MSRKNLPWWTWVAPLLLFHLGTQISLLSRVNTGTSLFYFPAAFAVVLIYWWGPRIVPAFYINAMLSAGLWGLDRYELWPIYAAPEAIFALLSWFLFIRLFRGRCWLPNIRQTVLFLMVGVSLPLLIYKFIEEGIFLLAGDLPKESFWHTLVATSLGDFISLMGITIPILYFFSGPMAKRKLAIIPRKLADRWSLFTKKIGSPVRIAELALLACLLIVMSQTLALSDYWFIYGGAALYTAIRWGMATVVVINSLILLITYLLPSILDTHFVSSMTVNNEMLRIQLGSSILYVFSTVTGRVISDVGIANRKLNLKNKELEQANRELDRFVYSASHDLSAPLKSIQGLVNISLLDSDNKHKEEYLSKIGQSASKLESFIKEILDYSRNKRMMVQMEQISIYDLCKEIIDDLKYMDRFQEMKFDFDETEGATVYSDRFRLKIILNNLFSNAIKFQKKQPNHPSFLKVYCKQEPLKYRIVVSDNGEGIKKELQPMIFDMFFRANPYSVGSGLGLYIAQEAAEKVGARLSVKSEYGRGSDFILEIRRKST